MPWNVAIGPSQGNWTVPSNVVTIIVDCIGPGANGQPGPGGLGAMPGGAGGGGGAYSRRTMAVTPGQVISYYVGEANSNTYTQFGPNYCLAYGAVGQSGGNADNGVGDVRYWGGNGGAGGGIYATKGPGGGGGGGGGAAGYLGNGGAGGNGDTAGYPYVNCNGGAGGGSGSGYPGGGQNTGSGGNGLEYGSWGAGGGGGGGRGAGYPSYPNPTPHGGPGGAWGAGSGGGGGQGGNDGPGGVYGSVGGLLMIYYDPVPAPTVTGCTPNSGPIFGGTGVTITGTNFTGVSSVTIGGVAATSVSVPNANTLTCVTPAHAAGLVSISVTAIGGGATGANLFTYIAPKGGANMPMMGI